MIKNRTIIDTAIYNLAEAMGGNTPKWRNSATGDGVLSLQGFNFCCLVRSVLNTTTMQSLVNQCKSVAKDLPSLLVVGEASQLMMQRAQEYGVNVLESSGNCLIVIKDKLYINISGRRSVFKNQSVGLDFKEAGLKVLFTLLTLDENKVPTIRTLSEKSGASVGTVKNVLDTLVANKFIFTSSKGKFLKNLSELVDLWVTTYNNQQRADNIIGHAKWHIDSNDWMQVSLPEGMTWGGDCGAYQLTQYMKPEEFCIYSDAAPSELVKTRAIIPHKEGNIVIYRKFWNGELNERAKAIIYYADLLNSDSSRSHEAAQKLRDERLTYTE